MAMAGTAGSTMAGSYTVAPLHPLTLTRSFLSEASCVLLRDSGISGLACRRLSTRADSKRPCDQRARGQQAATIISSLRRQGGPQFPTRAGGKPAGKKPGRGARSGQQVYAIGGTLEVEEPFDITAEVKTEKVLVLGGNGFVGSAICKAALAQGMEVVSLNRSGPPSSSDLWVQEVTWLRGDVFSADWSLVLDGVTSVISCIGGFGSNEAMERICGDATIAAVEAASKVGVPRFLFISVHDYNLPEFALSIGYFKGKRRAEEAVLAAFPKSGVVLRPGFIYGRRRVGGTAFDVPLDLVGRPLEALLAATERFTKPLQKVPGSDVLLAPPIDVEDVARVAVRAVQRKELFGVVSLAEMKETARVEG
eukprot:TRINITY_DN10830_c0_g1_i2.p1 TRINITY_DN10830_c0_g1~~TRINITY_DN10830_c0_g1_i2.p1  ORF type:complete len:365 (+),score=54.85 TRINITY_DN10830_c0_g1_i2:90-1184(+)